MDWIFLGMIIFLFGLAIFDLWVGVSNDAVNFLNGAVGAKAAKFKTVIAIAAAGVRVANLVESKCSNEAAIREELMAEAVRNARRMADVLAEAAGVEVNSVHSIEMPSVRTYYGTVRAMSFKGSNDAVVEENLSALNLEVRDVEMSASVNVVYGFVAKEK